MSAYGETVEKDPDTGIEYLKHTDLAIFRGMFGTDADGIPRLGEPECYGENTYFPTHKDYQNIRRFIAKARSAGYTVTFCTRPNRIRVLSTQIGLSPLDADHRPGDL